MAMWRSELGMRRIETSWDFAELARGSWQPGPGWWQWQHQRVAGEGQRVLEDDWGVLDALLPKETWVFPCQGFSCVFLGPPVPAISGNGPGTGTVCLWKQGLIVAKLFVLQSLLSQGALEFAVAVCSCWNGMCPPVSCCNAQ